MNTPDPLANQPEATHIPDLMQPPAPETLGQRLAREYDEDTRTPSDVERDLSAQLAALESRVFALEREARK